MKLSNQRRHILLTLLAICAAGPQALFAADTPKPLVFCAEPAAMPRTGKAADDTAQGIDVAIARLVCKNLGREFEVHWCANAACARRCLREKRCDIILGQPHEEDAPKDVGWSVPYAGSQFGLVVPDDAKGIRSLTDLATKRVGIVAGTVALSEKDHELVRFKERDEVLNRFTADKLDAAFIDADFAAWHLRRHPELKLRLVADYVPREHWNMGMAVRADNAALLVDINKTLAHLAESGELKKAYESLGVPHRAPFTKNARRVPAINTWKRIQDRGEMVIAMDPANLPYSSAKDERPGFDVELARELGKAMGLKVRLAWLDIQRETAIGKLLQNECDLAFGAAIDPNAVEDDDELAERVIYSRPYYGTGYLLVTRKEGPHAKSLAELKGDKSRRLGTEAGSIADYNLRQRGYLRSLFRNQLAVLKAIDDKAIDYGYLWANVGWTLYATPEFKLQIAPGYVPEDHWNIGIAVRKSDDELKRRVDAVIEKFVKDGTVERALAQYHVPYFAPFEDAKKDAKGDKDDKDDKDDKKQSSTIQYPPVDRGREPQMQKLLTSKNPYGGLERVRSAGMLVVGLDQRNLPFSTAHPEPAGLDYDIAKLLAEKLGVSLHVYWAYSAHDSYPSKLATKKLCDVMLGVMPDDRFGERVLYTKPYYISRYELVTLAEGAAPASFDQLGELPLAVERGVAVRGLEGRQTRAYGGLEEILDAVAKRQVPAGYVIAARGRWLAEKQFAGKLRFADGAAVDRFPICAAVRKTDGDLKTALEKAFDELDRSGQLAEVFKRWQLPYETPSPGSSRPPTKSDKR